jgi:hypothetical protein
MRFLLLLIVVLLLAYALWPKSAPPPVEKTFIAPQLETIRKAEDIEDQYMDALDRADAEIEKQTDGG